MPKRTKKNGVEVVDYTKDKNYSSAWDSITRRTSFRENTVWTASALFLLVLVVLGGTFIFKTKIIGFFAREKIYSDEIMLTVEDDLEFKWGVENSADLTSIRLNGDVSLEADVKAYIKNKERMYVLFDSKQLKQEKRLNYPEQSKRFDKNLAEFGGDGINIKLEYGNEEGYDPDNDGIENSRGIVDFTIKNTEFDFDVKKENLCTVWFVESLDDISSLKGCYGYYKCCNFLNLDPVGDEWDEDFYLNYGAIDSTYNNIVSAQIVYVDYDLSMGNAYSDVRYSSLDNLNVRFYPDIVKFDSFCVDTCSVAGFDASSYNIVVEVSGGTFNLYSITYTTIGDT